MNNYVTCGAFSCVISRRCQNMKKLVKRRKSKFVQRKREERLNIEVKKKHNHPQKLKTIR